MLFAAGFGTRMRPLTATRPKPLVEVAGRPLIDHALDLAHRAGIRRIVANLHYRAEMLEAHLQGSGVVTVTEHPDILDTGGGLRNALPLLGDGPVLTLNTDAVWTGPNPLATLRETWRPGEMDALLLLVPKDAATGHAGPGDFLMDGAGRLSRGPGLVFGGAQIVEPAAVETVSDRVFSLNRVWDDAAARGRLFGVVHPGGWCDVGRPASIPVAEALLSGTRGHV